MKSSFSNPTGNCIEVDTDGVENGYIILTETDKNLDDPFNNTMYTNKSNFKAFIDGVKAGEFDHFVEGV